MICSTLTLPPSLGAQRASCWGVPQPQAQPVVPQLKVILSAGHHLLEGERRSMISQCEVELQWPYLSKSVYIRCRDDLERMGDRSPIRMKTPGRLRGESRDDGPPMQQRTSRGAYSPLRLQVPMTTRGPFPRTPKTPAQKVQQEHQALRYIYIYIYIYIMYYVLEIRLGEEWNIKRPH